MPTKFQLDADVEPLLDVLADLLPLIAHAVASAHSDEPLYFAAVGGLIANMAGAFVRAVLREPRRLRSHFAAENKGWMAASRGLSARGHLLLTLGTHLCFPLDLPARRH
jgi:hypothetical protein